MVKAGNLRFAFSEKQKENGLAAGERTRLSGHDFTLHQESPTDQVTAAAPNCKLALRRCNSLQWLNRNLVFTFSLRSLC